MGQYETKKKLHTPQVDLRGCFAQEPLVHYMVSAISKWVGKTKGITKRGHDGELAVHQTNLFAGEMSDRTSQVPIGT
jgi:hypothetical protein